MKLYNSSKEECVKEIESGKYVKCKNCPTMTETPGPDGFRLIEKKWWCKTCILRFY